MFVGADALLVTADVSFDADHGTENIDDDITRIEEALRERDDRVKVVYIEPER